MNLGRAIRIASKAFDQVEDKGGKPYILHCLWVMNKVRHLGEDYMIAAVLHDLIEDSPHWELTDLEEQGFDEDVILAIDLLTHPKGMSYMTYIRRLSNNKIARAVKMRDLEHNSKITRLKDLRPKDSERNMKYHKAYTYLKNQL